ncbi:PilZ domain-containing protein [Telmatospirillum sp.]|uniref:PilZ domain-containing protein n=1 Tax=Telmatospirillum sp. TaxID=2079197 RepID=UPI00283B193D|nr:PilZ domain-containing protein [Telmatospirillum sp.]MDR3441025.1 PilZ domain-containing protein [Telmatospirillum sp.]
MTSTDERRKHNRHYGKGLVLIWEGQTYPILNVSPGGLCLRDWPCTVAVGSIVEVKLANEQTPLRQIAASCRIVAIKGNLTHAAFTLVTMPLLTFLMAHIASILGVTPYYFDDGPSSV